MMHSDRRRAESFGSDAERYDRSRPTYPDGLIDDVLGGGDPLLDVVDVGCGTGIASALLAARGARVLGVEVDARMAEVARRKGIEVEVSGFEEWDPAGRTFDRLTAAQAWHWVDPVDGAAKAATVLRPGGRLALFWNRGRPDPEVAAALDRLYADAAPGTDSYSVLLGYSREDGYASVDEGIRACPRMGGPVHRTFPWSRAYSRQEWLDQLPTHSDHAALEPAHLQELLGRVGEVIDSFGGGFTMHYDTLLISADRLDT